MKQRELKNRPYKDTLVIIGNGFDLWQGCNTSYTEFQKDYLAHRDEILRKLHIKKHKYLDELGNSISLSDVELIYGDPFEPAELRGEFWGTFETSLADIDAERINMFFGKDFKGLKKMRRCVQNANWILREAFCSWIGTTQVAEGKEKYDFGDNCLFINFNYTDTLRKRFGVKEEDECHIHGEATDKRSIIFGHSSHPELPEEMLYEFGGRFRGLYFIEEILYMTDKHVEDHMQELCMFLAIHGVMPEAIKHVYVLGHSMSLPDIEYFIFFANATKKNDVVGIYPEKEELRDELEEQHKRLQYAIKHSGYGMDKAEIEEENRDAVTRRFLKEQEARNKEYQKMFMDALGKGLFSADNQEVGIESTRTEDAMWHISYYSYRDKVWAQALMKTLGCNNVVLYPTIDECLQEFIH